MSQPEEEDREEAAAQAGPAISTRTVPDEQRWLNYKPGQREQAQEVKARREKLGLSLKRFCEYSSLQESTLAKLENGTSQGAIAKLLKEALAHCEMRERMAMEARKRPEWTFRFHSWDDFVMARLAVRNALAAANEIKEGRHGETISLVDLVMPSGWGKDEIYGELNREFGGSLIRARGSWRDSKLAAASSIAEQLGILLPTKRVRTKKGREKIETRFWRSYDECENAILRHLKETPRVLYFIELDLCEVALCDLWKEISNETRCVIVRFWVPQSYARMIRQTGSYGEQTNARTERVITAGPVPVELVTKLFADHAPKVKLDALPAAWLAAYATELQGLRCVIGVAREMAADPSLASGRAVTLTRVRDHVTAWRKVHGLRFTQVAPEVTEYMPRPVWPKEAA